MLLHNKMLIVIAWMLTISSLTDLTASEVAFYYYSQNRESFCALHQQKVLNEASTIGCASLCLQYQGQGYILEDGECTLMGSLTEPSVGEKMITYQRVSYLTNGENIALGKATESAAFFTGQIDLVKDLAVDGIEESDGFFHSHPSVIQPWWYVDLGENRVVNEVHVLPYGNQGRHSRQFSTIEIRIGQELPATEGNFSNWSLLSYYEGPAPSVKEYLVFSVNGSYPLCGRYVSIQKMGTSPNEYYVLTEVKVFALEKALDF